MTKAELIKALDMVSADTVIGAKYSFHEPWFSNYTAEITGVVVTIGADKPKAVLNVVQVKKA